MSDDKIVKPGAKWVTGPQLCVIACYVRNGCVQMMIKLEDGINLQGVEFTTRKSVEVMIDQLQMAADEVWPVQA